MAQHNDSSGTGSQTEAVAQSRPRSRSRTTRLVPWAVLAAGLALLFGLIGSGAGTAGASKAVSSSGHTLTITDIHIAKVGTVLTTKAGFTLYHFTADPTGKATCTGPCAKVWPPALVPSGDKIKGPRGLKDFSTIRLSGGRRQLDFHGEALYRFAGDKHKGAAGGQGVEGTWFAVLASNTIKPAGATGTTGTTAAPSSSGSASTTTTSGAAKANASTTPTTKAPQKSVTTTTAGKGSSPAPTAPPATTPTTNPPPPPTTTTPTTAPPSGGYGY